MPGITGIPNRPGSAIPCVNCNRPVHGIPETRYSEGWVHTASNSEWCQGRNTLAEPKTYWDTNEERIREARYEQENQ